MGKKAVFFDLDGTLWDAITPIMKSRNIAMKENNLSYSFDYKTIKSYMGLTPLETVVLAFKDVSIEKGLEYFKLCIHKEIEYLRNNPGIMYKGEEEALSLLKEKYPLYIVSNCDKGYIENYLESLNMSKYFKGHLSAGDTGLEKYQNIKLLKEKEGIDEVVYVGDTLKDYAESTKANVKFIHASYGFGVIEEDVYKISSLKELPSKLEEVFKD